MHFGNLSLFIYVLYSLREEQRWGPKQDLKGGRCVYIVKDRVIFSHYL